MKTVPLLTFTPADEQDVHRNVRAGIDHLAAHGVSAATVLMGLDTYERAFAMHQVSQSPKPLPLAALAGLPIVVDPTRGAFLCVLPSPFYCLYHFHAGAVALREEGDDGDWELQE